MMEIKRAVLTAVCHFLYRIENRKDKAISFDDHQKILEVAAKYATEMTKLSKEHEFIVYSILRCDMSRARKWAGERRFVQNVLGKATYVPWYRDYDGNMIGACLVYNNQSCIDILDDHYGLSIGNMYFESENLCDLELLLADYF